MAHGRYLMRKAGMLVVNQIATNSANLCALALCDTSNIDDSTYFCITSTARLVYNSCPVKVSSTSVLSAAMHLAKGEKDDFLVSNAVGTRSNVLMDICESILGDKDMDAVWCSWVLVNYLCSHPRGRDLLKESGLTDVDVQSAIAFERYGGEEIRRRARQRKSQASVNCKRHGVDEASRSGDQQTNSYGRYAGACGKRKRAPRSSVAPVCSDCHTTIEFWHNALQSVDASVLHTLAAHNKQTVRDAALSTLARQAAGTDVGHNVVLQSVSLENAIKSAKALVSFVGRRVNEMPSVLLCCVADPETGNMRTAAATTRIDKEAASSALHACTLPHSSLRPAKAVGIAIAWSHVTKKLMPSTETSATIPGILERYARMSRIENAGDSRESNKRPSKYGPSARTMRDVATMGRFVDTESEMAIPRHATGTTRSFLSMAAFMCINNSHEQTGSALLNELKTLDLEKECIGLEGVKLPMLLKSSHNNDVRSEPLCTPSSPLAVGICANEMLRRWMVGKTRKNDPCKKHLGFSSPSEVAKDMPGIMSSEPLPLLTITDVQIEQIAEVSRTPQTMDKAPVAIGIHVCGDGAVRLPELLDALCATFETDDLKVMRETRAALFTGASQASFVGCVASSLTSGYTNASVSSSKKISVRLCFAHASALLTQLSPICTCVPLRVLGTRRKQNHDAIAV